MKLATQTSAVTVVGAAGQPSTFRIAASKAAFKILSSGLYNNKIRAIIRELACNAFDAHVAANKRDVPFYLHLPTELEPWFSVRDEGTGLSHEHVLALYTTYFGTDKSDSNEFIGALGLGSKSPFCYTEGFAVTSRHAGWTRVYSCYIDEEGKPAVLLQTEEQTGDPAVGLEVTFPVETEDVWEFENQARRALEFFVPRPTVNIELEIVEKEYTLRTERWGLRRSNTRKVRAIQGMVQYDVGSIDESRLTRQQSKLLNLPLDLFFEIGELAVAASRESLSNDERTVANILHALDLVAEEMVMEVRRQLAGCRTAWEARLLLHNLTSQRGGVGAVVDEAVRAGALYGAYEGFTLTGDEPAICQLDYPSIAVTEFDRHGRSERWARKQRLTQPTLPSMGVEMTDAVRNNYRVRFDNNEAATLFLINDLGRGADRYAHWTVQEHPTARQQTVYLISRASRDVTVEVVVSEGRRLVTAAGNPPCRLLSEVKAEYAAAHPRDEATGEHGERRTLFRFNPSAYVDAGRKGWQRRWVAVKPDDAVVPDGQKFYVPLKNLAPTTGNFADSAELKEFIQSVQKTGLFPDATSPLYGVPASRVAGLGTEWTELTAYVAATLVRVMTAEREHQLSLRLHPFDSDVEVFLKKVTKKNLLPADSPVRSFALRLAVAQSAPCDLADKAVEALSTVVAWAEGVGAYRATQTVDFEAEWAAVAERYPLLAYLDAYDLKYRDECHAAVAEYIAAVDAAEAAQSVATTPSDLTTLTVEEEKKEDSYVN